MRQFRQEKNISTNKNNCVGEMEWSRVGCIIPVNSAGKTSCFHFLLLAIAAAVVGPKEVYAEFNKNQIISNRNQVKFKIEIKIKNDEAIKCPFRQLFNNVRNIYVPKENDVRTPNICIGR